MILNRYSPCLPSCDLLQTENGEYVLYKDYKTMEDNMNHLLITLDRLEKENQDFYKALERISKEGSFTHKLMIEGVLKSERKKS